jgi:tetratricopeptide (TPR) repeat protein
MLSLTERAKARISSFIAQRRDLLLIVHASDADAVFVLQLTNELDEASGEDLFVILGGEFHDPESYAASVTLTFVRQHALAAEAVLAAGKPPLPELPASLLASGPAHERLRALVAFAHQLLPDEARRLVVVIAPTLIENRMAFLALMAALLPRPQRERWMARLRLVVRDIAFTEAADVHEHPLVSRTSAGIAVTQLDFGPGAIRQSLAATAEDPSVPEPARMQSLLSSAIVDGVYGAHSVAAEKLLRVLAYYQAEKNLLLQAVSANALGEVCVTGGALDRAQEWFECALGLAVESESALALATVAKNLGNLCFGRGDYASAAQYFDGLARIAPKLLDNETMSWALERRGASEAALGRNAQAIETWRQGAELCRNTDHNVGLREHLTRLKAAYAGAGLMQDQALAERELGLLGQVHQHA